MVGLEGCGWPQSVLGGSDGREDLNGGGLDELKRFGKRGFVTLPKLDVVTSGGACFEADRVADYERYGFGLRLTNGFVRFSASRSPMQNLMRAFMGKDARGFGGREVRQ
jgi:hypothetical protein